MQPIATQATKDRDEAIFQVAFVHPITTREIKHYGGFSTMDDASLWATKKANQRRLLEVGSISWPDWRPGQASRLYCNGWKPNKKNLRHEYITTLICLQFPDVAWQRGNSLDDKYLPDAKGFSSDGIIRIETDCDTMGYRKVLARWKKYEACEDDLLIVVAAKHRSSEERLRELVEWSDAIDAIAYFTTIERFLADPQGEVWEDRGGVRYRL